jgi:hypothetical protein
MWRGFTDWYLNSNHSFSSSNTNIATYSTSEGIGRLSISGGNLQWGTYDGSVTAGTAYSLTERMRITSGGNVMINTTSDIAGIKLQVNGAIFNSGSAGLALGGIGGRRRIQWDTGNNELVVLGENDGYFPIGASAFNVRSDYRLKEDLKEFDGLSLVTNMKVYDFKWKEKEERNYGFIAHELQEVVPYVVTGTKDGMYQGNPLMQGLDYGKIVPVLVKAIQELEARIKQLENK